MYIPSGRWEIPTPRRARLAACHYRVEGVAGTVGRIACRRRDFLYLQGYDEEDMEK
jgi:hypothetical protein